MEEKGQTTIALRIVPPPASLLRDESVAKNKRQERLSLLKSARALAIPVTFLMLFVSLSLLISLTYYVAIAKIAAKGAVLNASGAKQAMIALDATIGSVAWLPGASKVYYFNDFGGRLHVRPNVKTLAVAIMDGLGFSETIFNAAVGKVSYELPSSEQPYAGLFLLGDTRTIINQSSTTMSQLYIEYGSSHVILSLCYRPSASITVTSRAAKPVNNLRVYILSLNQSRSATANADFYMKTQCFNTVSTMKTYEFDYALTSITVKADLDDASSTLILPILSNENGAVLNVEVVVCSVKLEIV